MTEVLKNNETDSEYYINEQRSDIERAIADAIDDSDLGELTNLVTSLHTADLADILDLLPKDKRSLIFNVILDKIDPELFVEIEDCSIKEELIEHLGVESVANYIVNLDLDDAASFLLSINEDLRESILNNVETNLKKDLEEVLSYPENSVGRVMQKNIVVVPQYWTLEKTLDYLRSRNDLPKEFYEMFIVDPKYKPIAFVTLGALLHHPKESTIKDIMQKDMKVIETNVDQEEMSYLFKQYGLISAPVVNKVGRLVGAVTVDNALEIIEKEAEEDIMHMGGVNSTDIYLNIVKIVTTRFPWLFVNLVTSVLAACVIKLFEGTIENVIVLAALMPIVASMGGNAGTQTMTVSVVAIASKELSHINLMRTIFKQVIACALNGLLLALIGGTIIYFWHHDLMLSLVFCSSIVFNFAIAGFFGSVIPVMIDKAGLDPAIVSPIFLTALTDICGFFSFLGLASMFLL